MARNVEEIFGGVVVAPHQIPFKYTSTNGGETFLSLPFYPITGFVTINGGVQVPLDNFELDGNTLNLGRELEPGDVVFCLFDKIMSPQDASNNAVRIYKFLSVGGETEFTPDFTTYGVQSLYIDGKYKTPGEDYNYFKTSGKVVLDTALPTGVWVVAEMSIKQNIPALAGDNGACEIGTESGKTVQETLDDIGYNLASVEKLMTDVTDKSPVHTHGFYKSMDGGHGDWYKTGNTNLTKAGTHDVSKALVYNAKGTEYALNIAVDNISVLANGAKSYDYAECIDKTTDNFVCLGQVINGIESHLTLGVSTANNIDTYDGGKRTNIIVPTDSYRIGKESAKLYSGVAYHLNASRIFVFAGASYQYSVTGKRLNGFQHGVDEITEKWEAVNRGIYWGSVSLQNTSIHGGTLFGDHTIRSLRDECSSGVGVLVLNPEGFSTHGLLIRETFMWALVETTAEVEATEFNQNGHAFDNDSIDYKYIVDAWVNAGITSRFGNFNRTAHNNSKFMGGRRGTYRNGCDWSALYNCEVTNRLAWRNAANVSGEIPEYIAVCTGTAMHVSGGYWGPAAAKDYNARYGTVYGTAQNHVFTAVYTEWTYNFYTVSAWGFNGKASRLQGLHLDLVSVYKDNFTEYSQIRFEGGCFGTIDDGGNYTYPEGFYHYDTPNGQTAYAIGSPVRDTGAFRHNGFDFKYGPYNMYLTAGTDWDSWRDRPYAKEMFNPYGMQINSGTAFLPWQIPATKSMVCFWIKDLTGNFDPRNIVAWITAASQDGPNTDEALYKSFAEKVVDFGNGYKMLMLAQKRLSAWDGQYTFARNANITVTVPAETPIVLKAVEAYTGGIPLFPNGCGNYTPESSGTSILSPVTNQVGLDSSLGGGLFFNGDIIGPWVHMRRTASGYRFSPSLTNGYTLARKMVTGGYALDSSFKVAFSATITAVNSNNTTIIEVPTAQLPYIAVGIPLYVTGGSSTSATGTFHLVKRIANADGTSSARYLVQGVLGAVGDVLTVDQNQLSSYTFFNDMNYNALTAATLVLTGTSQATAHRSSVSAGIGYGGASGTKAMEWYFNGGTTPSHRLVASSASGMTLEAGGNFSVAGNTFPSADGTYSLGTSSSRWTQVFANNSTIATSNRDKKTNIRQITPVEVSAFYEIAMLNSVWQWMEKYQVEGDDARLHSGPTVQDAIEIMDKYGLDWTQYSAFCYDKWDARDAVVETWDAEYETIPGTDAEYDEEGNLIVEAVPEVKVLVREAGSKVIEPALEAGEDYAFRKEELLFWITRAIVQKQKDIETRLSDLESKFK
ncbi:tail fiber protein [Klebsiella phage May]|uniref:Tail spike protein n=1 Tax=Klebsiella phage May TaxID=2054272 RepID=A0A2H5BNP5_9CAUD|nr:tail fiber protein [Klebsiella phage May]AUG87959.1 tail spike protein [Klebsiella phage May]